MDLQPQPSNAAVRDSPELRLDGSWETHGRSPNTAAVVALLGIGAIFFNAESILAAVAIGIKILFSGVPEAEGGVLDRLAASMKFYGGPIRLAVLISEFAFLLVPALWLVKRWHSSDVRGYIRLKNGAIVEILIAVLATLAVIPTGEFIADNLVKLMHIPARLLEINAEVFTSRSELEFGWLIIVVCVTPAICEEVFFRGFIQRTFERTMGWKSVLLIGFLFGLFHFQPLGLITLSILGILFGYFFYRSKSLYPSMAAHFTNNLVAIAVLYRPDRTVETEMVSTQQLPIWLVGVTLLVGVGLLFLYQRVTVRHFSVTAQQV
ncbi:MAG TPA: CPBP family intramembrane glutamic endopeptidase [Bacteroidota bacterium]